MASGIAEIFTDCSTGKWSIELEGSRISRRRRNDDGIVHGTLFRKGIDNVGNG